MSTPLLSIDVEPDAPLSAFPQLHGSSANVFIPSQRQHRRFTTTVPKEYVHRASVAEVLLTDWLRLDDSRFIASAQWPRAHSYFTSPCGLYYDSTLVAETIRQVGTLVSHAEYGVPLNSHFILNSLQYRCEPAQLEVLGAPAELSLSVTCSKLRRTGGQVAGVEVGIDILRDGRPMGSGLAKATMLRPEVYRRIRGGRLAPGPGTGMPLAEPVEPALVDRRYAPDVVLSPGDGPRRWLLRADRRHPVLFEHPGDHIPGMVLLEAARQVTRLLAPGSTAVAAESSFERYVEFDAPCLIEAEEHDSPDPAVRTVSVRAEQDGRTAFTTTITLAVPTA
ncbi:AfsA/ScbA [Streptacidiphilus sp. ASG 303]|uniref:ScbA/BarX family gamma-butyrolactone biosynthesis protein n=1 Tax=Streptacidiphilus sp. ASG 303 TaxID=2896847 RepID=UPI001E3763BE|nr:ScbA/BarX family gamma-butyrolactone biosynthesis protein [Streptacidiphilus sp. ASG 303]MCD0484545.1 AfsA/ScbA [Streptacidiphilus sp. ASG 303]